MFCTKCGFQNNPNSKFCIQCGNTLEEQSNHSPMMNSEVEPAHSTMTNQKDSIAPSNITQPFSYLYYLIAILLKPIQAFKENDQHFNDTKVGIILTLLVSAIMTLSNLIKTIFMTVRVTKYSFLSKNSTTWEWENLKNIPYFDVIVKNFCIYTVIIFAIAGVFYLGSLVIKKEIKFSKSLAISASSMIPAITACFILSPILNIIWNPLSVMVSILGVFYSFIIFYELINEEINLDIKEKVYFNSACFTILVASAYFIYMRMIASSISDALDYLK